MEYYLQKKKTIKNREMRNFTFKGLFLAVVFIVLGSLSIQAADGLITKQITIKLDEAGTLPNKIGSTKKFQITNLKIIGEINGRDLQMIREMAGKDVRGNDTDGMLSVLDLSDAKIVEGGGYNINGFYYPTSNDKIGDNAFCDCSGLTSLTLPSDVTEIGNAAFEGCSGLASLTLPSGVAKIGDYAFHGCSGLTSIYVYAEKLPNMGNDVFEGCDAKKCTVYVLKGTYDDYWLSEFGYFENIVEFDPTGINNVITSNDAKELSRYSLNGQRLSAPSKGLNIVKYSDGSVKKVVVQ
ncbi:leucine-rich repeat domain-containing protein [Prevotella copri]|nr:leucine-rich repeat domain-containing protein [Segatella copri]